MKKIDGTLYSPIAQPNGDRQKMYVETVPEAVVFEDGSTLKDRLDTKSNSVVISTTKPTKECLWINPSGINPATYFNFTDLNVNVPTDSTPVHTLKSPANKDGVRENVYPLTDAKDVRVNTNTTLNDVFSRYDMGFEAGRDKPDHKSFWGEEAYQTATITDLGKEEEVILLNDFLGAKVKIGNTTYNASNLIFNINNEKMVFFDPTSKYLSTGDTIPNRSCFWIDTIYRVRPTDPDLSEFLLDTVVIDSTEYHSDSLVIKYNNENFVFFNPDRFIESDTVPKVYEDTIWANTDV